VAQGTCFFVSPLAQVFRPIMHCFH
jgi:hypothetical protein